MTKRPFVSVDVLPRTPPFNPREAVAECRQRVRDKVTSCGHKEVAGNCGHFAGCNYGFSTCGSDDAIGIWFATDKKYRRPGLDAMMNAPAGAVLIWSGGSEGHGHAGIKGEGPHVYGTDLPVFGQFGRFEIDKVTDEFTALTPVGWVFPIFPTAVSDGRKPPEVRPPERKRRAYPNIDDIIRLQHDTIAAAKRAAMLHDRRGADRALAAIVRTAREQIAAANALRTPAKKTAGQKAAAKKTTAKKTAAKKTTAKKTTAKKTTAKKTTAKKTTAKKTAKKSAATG
jgi:hypothetical protein